MKFSVITIFPEMIEQSLQYGVIGQALRKKLLQVETINPRLYTFDFHKTVDDRPFGGTDGMVMRPDVLDRVFENLKTAPRTRRIYLSPQGSKLTESKVQELKGYDQLVLLSGRYAGVDQRVLNQWIDEEISIGDYVLSGGELPALVLIDAVGRKVSGVLGDRSSAEADSFSQGRLEAPLFTRPADWKGQVVPGVIREGNHQKIQEWNDCLAGLMTLVKRPDLAAQISIEEKKHLRNFYQSLSQEDKNVCHLKDEKLNPLFESLFNG